MASAFDLEDTYDTIVNIVELVNWYLDDTGEELIFHGISICDSDQIDRPSLYNLRPTESRIFEATTIFKFEHWRDLNYIYNNLLELERHRTTQFWNEQKQRYGNEKIN